MGSHVTLSMTDGSWDKFCKDWQRQCAELSEDFTSFSEGSLSIIQQVIDEPTPQSGVLAVESDGKFVAVCQVNTALIKGYDSPVLRVRHITLSPYYDLGEATIQEYADALVELLIAVLSTSSDHAFLKAQHIKFHLRSPADQQFFAALGRNLDGTDSYETVQMRGAWLYLTKKVTG